MIFIDSNVLIDVLVPNDRWSRWAAETIEANDANELVINHVILAEIARRFETLDIALGFLATSHIAVVQLSETAAFRAGHAHAAYRRAGGPRQSILADFLIGAHASVLDAALVTRDRKRFATYFPELDIISPEGDDD